MINDILNCKILGFLSVLLATMMVVYSIMAPTTGIVALTVLAISYAGLIGIPALIRGKFD